MTLPKKPLTRQEQYLSKIAGENTKLPEKPLTREEMYLDEIAKNGGGGGGGGTSDFNDLENRPKYNGTEMTGETNIPAAPTVVQTTGTSTTDVMSQDATTKLVFKNNDTSKICIGNTANAGNSYTVAVGYGAKALASNTVALGRGANAGYLDGSVALGPGAQTERLGEVNVGTTNASYGFAASNYRVIAGVYPGIQEHDAATRGQLDGRIKQNAGTPTTATVGTVGQLLQDTTNGKLYQCTAASGSTYTWTEIGAGGGDGDFVKTLTSADYNWNSTAQSQTEPYNCVALWLLDPGFYRRGTGTTVHYGRLSNQTIGSEEIVMVGLSGSYGKFIGTFSAVATSASGFGFANFYAVLPSLGLVTGSASVAQVVDDLYSDYTNAPLSANQGRILGERSNIIEASAPTTDTEGVLGQLYTDTSTMHTYQCTNIDDSGDDPIYTWTQRW